MSEWVAVGGIDPSGGAGLLRDFWSARAFAEFESRRSSGLQRPLARCVVTGWTEQGQGRPARVFPRSSTALRNELEQVSAAGTVAAVKVGMVPESCVGSVRAWLAGLPAATAVIVDPVLVASDGGRLGASTEAVRTLWAEASLLTPNRDEAASLFGGLEGAREWIHAELRASPSSRRPQAVLLKDPDPSGSLVCDRLVTREGERSFARARQSGADPRGTGCALATAIAVGCAEGRELVDAISAAIAWLDDARRRCRPGPDGRAHLPPHTVHRSGWAIA